jgi:acetyl esterase/lipase
MPYDRQRGFARLLFKECIMRRYGVGMLAGLLWLAVGSPRTWAAEEPNYIRTEDVIYGRKYGMALTMDVFTPKQKANGSAVLRIVSGGWFSSHAGVTDGAARPFLDRGYTVFQVVHGSQPKFTIPEAIADLQRAVRFIRANAKRFKIDPDRIGVTGGSAGGHLSCVLGTMGDPGNSDARDPIERMPCRVAAVACFFPPTDFLNYGDEGKTFLEWKPVAKLRAPLDFQAIDSKTYRFERITDEKKVREILRRISPIYHVSKDSAPTLIIHGDADQPVPIEQAKRLVAKLKEAGVPGNLVIKAGAGHGWPQMDKDMPALVDWFDKYLLKKEK